ncbi:uncharacterized protein UBRO_20454 [Ustilago bromivora]|uniref:DDE Tnp4 domain-containing protein n=1 Tax=Ustilago bromivora TaxID=307758 RepID=A0A1K0GIU1_9BASI|nr:uncharacterized protein UBRO_20454 [Ustilago bromivora]
MQFALEEERKHAAAWVCNTTGVEEWGKGWLVVNGTHVPLAWKPGVCSQEHFCYKGFHSMNVVLVILPHLLQIVKLVVGQPGRVQDLKVWASGSNILKKPHLYLDKGEFIWVDGGYGHSAITVGPFSHITTDKSQDLQYFNYMLSQVRVQVKHAIAYLKNRFQCLTGYHGNIYCVKDCITAAQNIHACIVAHTFVSRYDHPADIADLLLPSFSEDEVHEVVQGLQLDVTDAQDLRRTRCSNQQEYKLDLATATQGMLQYALSRHRSSAAHDL